MWYCEKAWAFLLGDSQSRGAPGDLIESRASHMYTYIHPFKTRLWAYSCGDAGVRRLRRGAIRLPARGAYTYVYVLDQVIYTLTPCRNHDLRFFSSSAPLAPQIRSGHRVQAGIVALLFFFQLFFLFFLSLYPHRTNLRNSPLLAILRALNLIVGSQVSLVPIWMLYSYCNYSSRFVSIVDYLIHYVLDRTNLSSITDIHSLPQVLVLFRKRYY